MILSNTEELHEKIETLHARIRNLEEALRALQASVSTQPHPLLDDEYVLAPQRAGLIGQGSASQSRPRDDEETLLDAFGRISDLCWRYRG